MIEVLRICGWVAWPLVAVALLLYGLLADRLWCAWVERPDPGQDPRAGLALIRALIATAPLLGLLGTVTGVIDCFGLIVEGGRPDLTSAGIGQALVSTICGLVVAVPAVLCLVLVEWGLRRRGEEVAA